MPAVTISAGYGCGGSVVAREVAERLGYPLLDRAISTQVAGELHVSVEEANEGAKKRTFAERFLGSLASMAGGVVGADADTATTTALIAGNNQVFRQEAERIMRSALGPGAVILGRGGAAALHGEPGVLTVRLFGEPGARVVHAMNAEQVDEHTAKRRQDEVDGARAGYVRHLYGCDIDDPELYDIQLDSTKIPASACVEIIATAFTAFRDRS